MARANPFDYINSITFTKDDMIRGSENPEVAEKDYVPFMANRQLSYFIDTIMVANEMNTFAELPNIMQYEFLFHTVPRKKRFSKWAKPDKSEDVDVIAKYFGYGKRRAELTMPLLSAEQIEQMRYTLDPGG